MKNDVVNRVFIGVVTAILAASVVGSFAAHSEAVKANTRYDMIMEHIKDIKTDLRDIRNELIGRKNG